MLGFAETFFAWLGPTGIPALLGLLVALAFCKYFKPGYLLSFSLGVLFWVYVDIINDSGDLDVNASFSGGWEQVIIVLLFVVGISAFFLLDRSVFSSDYERTEGLTIPILVALAIGVHGLGEGAAFANVAATTTSSSLIVAFGGEASGAAHIFTSSSNHWRGLRCVRGAAERRNKGAGERCGDSGISFHPAFSRCRGCGVFRRVRLDLLLCRWGRRVPLRTLEVGRTTFHH